MRNVQAALTVAQINSTMTMMQDKSLCLQYNLIFGLDYSRQKCQITWRNHVPGRENSGDRFNSLQQYMHILENNSYHCMLFDGSIIRVNFEFENNTLAYENLLWWPAPYSYYSLLEGGYSPVELMNDFMGDPKWFDAIKMRSPIRIDYDSSNDQTNHPRSHMHIEESESRMVVRRPICFNRFVDFIFRNFYPKYCLKMNGYDYIDYNIQDFDTVEYTASEVVI